MVHKLIDFRYFFLFLIISFYKLKKSTYKKSRVKQAFKKTSATILKFLGFIAATKQITENAKTCGAVIFPSINSRQGSLFTKMSDGRISSKDGSWINGLLNQGSR